MEFWIDVGGTFTDCIGRIGGPQIRRHKVLSSGVTKGRAAPASDRRQIVDPARQVDPAGFWTGYTLRMLDQKGRPVAESRVAGFDAPSGTLELAAPLPAEHLDGQAYELFSGEESPILAIRYLLGLRLDDPLPALAVRLGTTRGTNALITRRGAQIALVTTRGFGDVLSIGYQDRPKLFELAIHKPAPVFGQVLEIHERMAADGTVLQAVDQESVRSGLKELKNAGIESLAVCLLNAYVDSRHEQLVGRIAREVGFEEISLSSQVAPLIKIVSRGDTTVVDAYLNPVLRTYIGRLRASLGAGSLQILTSAGGLVEADRFVGKDSILSGPAGGVVGFAHVAKAAGFDRAIGFDMGGTSTDVSRYDGHYELQYETEKAGVRVVAPMMAIETVAAGGGSICRFDGVKLVVGPESAGADPGPVCYGRGGPLAITDMNFYQGKILAEHFPFPLDCPSVHARLAALAEEVSAATGSHYTPHSLAAGFLRVVNVNMVQAIRSVSIAKGCDPRDYVLVAFGAAAGQHACAVAGELGIRQVLLHPDAGVLSARGIGMAAVTRHAVAGVYRPYSEAAIAELDGLFQQITAGPRQELLQDGVSPEQIEIGRAIDLRYQGVESWLTIAEPDLGTYAAAYAAEHQKLYGYVHEHRPLEIVAVRVEAIGRASQAEEPPQAIRPRWPEPQRTGEIWFADGAERAGIFMRHELHPGDRLRGPAIVCEQTSTAVIDPGWEATVLGRGELLLTRQQGAAVEAVSTVADPVMLEVFNNQFAGIAQQMGITLRNTASSVNVKERLDFSCAVFTAAGDLVVNAPHIPVHLGAMSETVRTIVAENPAIHREDVFVTNDPYRGGAHLPDVTVVTPVHDKTGQLLFFTASRAHHAEIGGIVPGSMPPFSKNLAEEGVLISNFKVIDAGQPKLDELRRALRTGAHPSRAVDDNIADITAQTAANHQGVRDLLAMVDRYTLPVVSAYMGHIQRAAEQKMRAALRRMPDGCYPFLDHMDDGSPIVVTVTIAGDEAVVDFTGTGPVVPGNLNANRAIVTAAVMYCLRCLIDEEIPLNQGVLGPVRIVLPQCMLNPLRQATAEACAAVVGGNVETSQRVVDVILGALGVAAASQGTMNNLLFGDATFGYYETICGGAGATPQAAGADAVHTHMTNTRITDPEVIERRYPVRVLEFSIRRGSGGAGRQEGGNGVIRRLEFLRTLDVSILSQRRGPYPPFGLAGGEPGALGANTLIHSNGSIEKLSNLAQFVAHSGDVLIVATPGGGGYGNAK
jgi:5-oxoprolinase (ATP-hydrolysing)